MSVLFELAAAVKELKQRFSQDWLARTYILTRRVRGVEWSN
jgi:hypothetical protein